MRPGEGKAEARGGLLIKISKETGNADSESGRMCLCERYRYKEDSRVTRTQREIFFILQREQRIHITEVLFTQKRDLGNYI